MKQPQYNLLAGMKVRINFGEPKVRKVTIPREKVAMKPREERLKAGMWWDRAWTVAEGCAPISEGCAHCWAARQSHMWQHNPNPIIAARHAGLTTDSCQFNGTVRLRWDNIDLPRKITRPTVFSLWNEFFHEDVPLDFVDAVLATMSDCPQHLFMALTKRPENIQQKLYAPRARAPRVLRPNDSLPNVCMGVTVESQEYVWRIGTLLEAWPGLTFVSCEPLLGPVDLTEQFVEVIADKSYKSHLGCVITGGESGHGARPSHPDWFRSIRDQCAAAGVPFMFKQWGKFRPVGNYTPDGTLIDFVGMERVGRKFVGRMLDGREHNGWFGETT